MTSIDRTAYPRFKRVISATELTEAFTPTAVPSPARTRPSRRSLPRRSGNAWSGRPGAAFSFVEDVVALAVSTVMIHRFAGVELDDDPARVDVDRVWAFLSEHAYWGRWRTQGDVEKQVRGAWRVVAAYGNVGELIGFARAVSDGVAFAYLADLYVDSGARGRGLGKELARVMIDAGPGVDFRGALHTADAHGLYERFGFARPDHTYLERPGTHPTGRR